MERRSAVSPQPTKKKKKFVFYFEVLGGGLGMQRVHGGSSLMEWYLGLQGQGLEEDFDGYFTTLGGKILDSQREVSGLGLSRGGSPWKDSRRGGSWYWQGGGP